MARERLKSPRARLFVALDLPEPVLDGVAAWQRDALAGREGLRATAIESMHVTLAFLGYHPEREVEAIGAALGELEPVPVPIRFAPEPIGLPRRRPRALALAVLGEPAVAIQRTVAERLVAEGFYEPERREFRPHLTIARRRGQGDRRGRGQAGGGPRPDPPGIEAPLPPLPKALTAPFDAVRIALYRSELRPEGARYVRLSDVELPPSAAER